MNLCVSLIVVDSQEDETRNGRKLGEIIEKFLFRSESFAVGLLFEWIYF